MAIFIDTFEPIVRLLLDVIILTLDGLSDRCMGGQLPGGGDMK